MKLILSLAVIGISLSTYAYTHTAPAHNLSANTYPTIETGFKRLLISLLGAHGERPAHPEHIRHWTLTRAMFGEVKAQRMLAVMLLTGEGGVQDKQLGKRWLERAGNAGDSMAQFNLGLVHLSGDGVDPNSQHAYTWFEKSAENGYAKAQFNLACLLINPKEPFYNHTKALYWLKQAALQGDERAQQMLRNIHTQQHQGAQQPNPNNI